MDWDKDDYEAQQQAEAAPTGLQQTASTWMRMADRANSFLPESYSQSARSWYGGRNTEGREGGWDNTFVQQTFESYDAWQQKVMDSRQSKDPNDWLNPYDWLNPAVNDDANGIALWDDPTPRRAYRVGDVVRNGRAVPGQNLYDVFDEPTANQILGEYLLSQDEKARYFKDSDPARLNREVKQRTDDATEAAKNSASSLEYQRDVEIEQERLLDSSAPETMSMAGGILAGGMAMGTAAAAGASWTGPGALLAFAGGFAFGAGAAYLNQDQLTEQLARGNVKADRARDKYDGLTAVASKVTDYSGVGMKLISPTSNMVQGAYDKLSEGGVGDGSSAFYEVNPETGERLAGGAWQALDFVGVFADSALQFGSKAGVTAFQLTTGGYVGGQVATMSATGGLPFVGGKSAGFNERTGQWDEYEGAEFVWAVGAVGIDALQMGMAAALTKAGSASRNLIDPAQAGKKVDVASLNGMRFRRDAATGEWLAPRVTWTILAPSEAVKWVATSWRARNLAAGRAAGAMPASETGRHASKVAGEKVDSVLGTAVPGPDDYWRAALEMHTQSTFRDAILNGWAEGAEEFVQAILEPASFSESIDPGDAVQAALYGFAAGTGMGMGSMAKRASDDKKLEFQAKSIWMMRRGAVDLTPEQEKEWKDTWKAASPDQRKVMATPDEKTAADINANLKVYGELHKMAQMGSRIAITALNGMRQKRHQSLLARLNPKLDGARVLMGRGGEYVVAPNGMVDRKIYNHDAAVESAWQVVDDLRLVREGLDVQERSLVEAVRKLEAEAAQLAPGTPAREEIDIRLETRRAELAELDGARDISQRIADQALEFYEQFESLDPADKPARQAVLDELNTMIERAWQGQLSVGGQLLPEEQQELAKRAVSVRIARHPFIDTGHAELFMPQASLLLSDLKQDATTYIQQGTLKLMNADHDGDLGVAVNSQFLPGEELQQMRRGAQFVVPDTEFEQVGRTDANGDPIIDPDTGQQEMVERPITRWKVVTDPADGNRARIDVASDALGDAVNRERRSIMIDALARWQSTILKRYTEQYPVVDREFLVGLLDTFADEVEAQNYDAEQHFLDAMYTRYRLELLELADETGHMELGFLKSSFEAMWVEMQERLSANAAGEQERVSFGAPQALPDETNRQQEQSKRAAATEGLTLHLLLEATTETLRQAQGLHYAPVFTSAIDAGRMTADGKLDSELVQSFMQRFGQLYAGRTRRAAEEAVVGNPIEDRILNWLEGFRREAVGRFPDAAEFQGLQALVLLANLQVPDVQEVAPNQFEPTGDRTTLLQVLLKKSVAIEEHESVGKPKDDPIHKRITRLKRLTHSKGPHSKTANRALFEVFADVPLVKLAGGQADGIGGHLTLRQHAMSLMPLSPEARREQTRKWRRLPAYRNPLDTKHDPPYRLEEFDPESPDYMEMNAFTLLVDAIITEANQAPVEMADRNRTASQQFHKFHTRLREIRKQWYRQNKERLLAEAKADGESKVTPQRVMRDLLHNQPDIAQMIEKVIPDAAKMGIFEVREGQVWTASWLEEMLVHDSTAKAELMLFLHSKFAELNAMGGRIRLDREREERRRKEFEAYRKRQKKAKKPIDPNWRPTESQNLLTGIRDPAQIKSRFLRAVHRTVSNDPTGFQLDRLLELGLESQSLEEFMKAFNEDGFFTGGEADHYAYFDDASAFEQEPGALWKADLPAQLQRESLAEVSERLTLLSGAMAETEAEMAAEKLMLQDILEELRNPTGQGSAAYWAKQISTAIENAKAFPDSIGWAIRDQFMAMVQQGTPRTQDKGAPTPEAEPVGASQIPSMSGYAGGFAQEMDAQTARDWKGVMANLTGMAEGPVRVMMNDGTYLVVDFSSPTAVVEAMMDPRTRSLARAVVFPTVKDVNANNVTQSYRRISTHETDRTDAPLIQLLRDTSFGHLFPDSPREKMKLSQAEQLISMVDSGLRHAAREGNEKERERAEHMLQKSLNEFLVAFTHGPVAATENKDQLRQDLVRSYATVLANISLLPTDVRNLVKRRLNNMLHKRVQDTLWASMDMTQLEAAGVSTMIDAAFSEATDARTKRITAEIEKINEDDSLSDQERDAQLDPLKEELADLNDRIARYIESPDFHEKLMELPSSVKAAIEAWNLHINNDSDQFRMAETRLALLRYLNKRERVNRLVEKKAYHLNNKVRWALDNDPEEVVKTEAIKPEEWLELGAAAASIAIAESAQHTSSGVGLVPLKADMDETDAVYRYYDRSSSYLLDTLFDEQALNMVRPIARQAGYAQGDFTFDELEQQISTWLLSERHIGQWTELVVAETLKAQYVLKGSTTLGDVQRHGVAPVKYSDLVGAGWVSYEKPSTDDMDQHHSVAEVVVNSKNSGPGATFVGSMDPELYFKLEHHFVSELKVTTPNGDVIDLMKTEATEPYFRNDEVAASGYQILKTDRLQEELNALRQAQGPGEYKVKAVYVDVDKKPHTPAYVNSIYFDGVGRDSGTGLGPGSMAEMIFGTGGINKEGQQGPLDFAKAGKAFWQIVTTKFRNIEQIEMQAGKGRPLAEILRAKAMHMWTKEYETGRLKMGDNNALYKMMKMRHVVRGRDSKGKWVYLWAEDVIRRETAGEALPFTEYELIALSAPVLATLLGKQGKEGTDALTMPEVNLKNINTFPSLDSGRLRELGLENLGGTVALRDSDLAHVGELPIASYATDNRGVDATTPYEREVYAWQVEAQELLGNRNDVFGKNEVQASKQDHMGVLKDLIGIDRLPGVMAVSGVPFSDNINRQANRLGAFLFQQMQKLMGSHQSQMVWMHRNSEDHPNPSKAILTKVSVENDFRNVTVGGKQVGPVYGDTVIIDLDDLYLWSGRNFGKAKQEAQELIRAYAKRGVIIVLGAAGSQHLRSDVAKWMRTGEVRYRSVKGSNHFFMPKRLDAQESANIDALESMAEETRALDVRHINYQLVSDDAGIFASENAVLFDYEQARQVSWKRQSRLLLPAAMTDIFQGRRHLWNLPYHGEGLEDMWAKTRAELLPLLKDEDFVKHLKKQAGGVDGDPRSVPKMERRADGKLSTGTRTFDDALKILIQKIEANQDPIATGQTLALGDFYIVTNPQGQYMLARYGYKVPDGPELQRQLNSAIGDDKPVVGKRGTGVAVFKGELEETQTITPPLRVARVYNDSKGLRVVGDYPTDVMTKSLLEQIGFKAGYRDMPPTLAFPVEAMGRNGTRVAAIAPEQAISSKQARYGFVTNLREAFLASGIDFRRDMVKFLLGDRDRSEQDWENDWQAALVLLKHWKHSAPNVDRRLLNAVLDSDAVLFEAQMKLNEALVELGPAFENVKLNFAEDKKLDDVTRRIGQVFLVSLMVPGIDVGHIIGTQGALTVQDPNGDSRATLMPPFFTEALNNPSFPETRKEMNRRINANAGWGDKLSKNSRGEDVPIYELDLEFNFWVRMRDPQTGREKRIKTKLQRVDPYPHDRGSASLAMAQLSEDGAVTPHVAAVSAESVGAWTALKPKRKFYDDLAEPNELEELFGVTSEGEEANRIIRFRDDTDSFYDIFARVKTDMETYSRYEQRMPGQRIYSKLGLDKRTGYYKAIDKPGWGPDADAVVRKILDTMGLDSSQAYEIDILVRQFLGAPAPTTEAEEGQDQISERMFVQAVSLMQANLDANMNPLEGGYVLVPDESLWAKMYDASRKQEGKGWAPVGKKVGLRKREMPTTWEGWVDTLMGQVINSRSPFKTMFQLDNDGFFHTYQGTTPTYASMPLSMDVQRDLQLMDPEMNHYFISLDRGTDALAANPMILEMMDINLATLTGHNQDIANQRDAAHNPAGPLAERIDHIEDWLKKKKVPKQEEMSVREFFQQGVTYRESSQRTTNFIQALNHLQILNRLANGGLWVSALLELQVKTAQEQVTNLISGRTYGKTGVAIAKAMEKAGRGADTQRTFRARYKPEEVRLLNEAAKTMAASVAWRAELYKEILYEQSLIRTGGPGKRAQQLERAAAAMARITSDPHLGMLQESAALRYLEAAMEYMETTGQTYNVAQLTKMLSNDPLYFKKQFAQNRVNPHSVGVNRVARVRGTRQSWINKVGLGWADRLEQGDTFGRQFLGFAVNVPFRFKRFNVGMFLSLTGFEGLDQAMAMMRDQRPKDSVIGRLQAAMRGEPYLPGEEMIDHSDILDGIDLTRTFARGAMTHVGLMAAAMWAGSLNLDGEDDETKRRRRMAQYLNGLYVYDPRKVENDFLYKDALFLDSVPFFDKFFYDEDIDRSVIVPHWIFRPFTSPVMGIQRFMNTGDLSEIKHGFLDGISAIPTSAMNMWREAEIAADVLARESQQEMLENGNTQEVQTSVSQNMVNIVAVYWKALAENSMVNAVRNGQDRYDRDPYREPATDDNGDFTRFNGLPVPTEVLETYRGEPKEEGKPETGELGKAYVKRPDDWSLSGARTHAYAENNATFALLASLFTGQFDQSSFARENMLVKEQKVQLPESEQAEAEALILGLYKAAGGQDFLTFDEIVRIRKKWYTDNDIYWDESAVEAEAQAIYDATSGQGDGGLSLLDEAGNEVIAKDGATGIYKGLWSGNVEFEDAVLDGIVIPWEMRDQIAAEWVDELIQEGVDMGMSKTGAMYYARRIYWGDSDDPTTVPLRDIIYDDRIPGTGTVKYNQLNMTYMIGPDGKPWATPFERSGVLAAFGVPVPQRTWANATGMSKDERGKAVDDVLGINVGLHGVERKPQKPYDPPDPFDKIGGKDYSPSRGKKGYGRSYSGGGGGYWPRLNPFPRGAAPSLDRIPYMNADNPYIRRANVNRQRIWSERGRLKQWQ